MELSARWETTEPRRPTQPLRPTQPRRPTEPFEMEPPMSRSIIFRAASALSGVVALVAVIGAGVKWW